MQSTDLSGGFPALFQGRNWKRSGYWKLGGCPFTRTLEVEKHLSISTPRCASRIWVEVRAGLGRWQQRAPRALSKWTVGDQWGTNRWTALQKGPHPMPDCLRVCITKGLNLLGLFFKWWQLSVFLLPRASEKPFRRGKGETRKPLPVSSILLCAWTCDPRNVRKTIYNRNKKTLKRTYSGSWFSRFTFLSIPYQSLGGKKRERVRFIHTFR